jgi:hypothetical protein
VRWPKLFSLPGADSCEILSFSSADWSLCRKLVVVSGLGFTTAAAGYAGSLQHSDVAPPAGPKAETELIDALQATEDSDRRLIGDLVIERFYAIDLDTGQRIVADLCKGRILDVSSKVKYDWTEYTYALDLDRTGLQTELGSIAAFVSEVAPPALGERVRYAGLQVQPGTQEKLQVNYVGVLPDELVEFVGPQGEDEFAYLAAQVYTTLTRFGPQLIDVQDNKFLLTNTEHLSAFRELFNVRRAVILAQLLLVDATSAHSQ